MISVRTIQRKNKNQHNAMIIFSIVCFIFSFQTFSQTKTEIKKLEITVTPPKNFNPEDKVNIIGPFNQWAYEGNNALLMTYKEGKLHATINHQQDTLIFNIIKNYNYSVARASATGKPECPIIYHAKQPSSSLTINIPAWQGDPPLKQTPHTLTGNIQYLKNFAMPELNRQGDIVIYLPSNYQTQTTKHYPVLYMLDGQNIFDAHTAYSTEWQVDEILEKMTKKQKIKDLIVVAVPNSPQERWNEYAPWKFSSAYGDITQANGNKTFNFIKSTLKPHIDRHFRTQKNAKNTGLAGSSLAGLMAFYAALEYDDIFGFVAAFSPSLALDNNNKSVLIEKINEKKQMGESKIYVDIGDIEYNGYDLFDELYQALVNKGYSQDNLRLVKDDLGRHCEDDWRKRFPNAITWLLNNK